MNPESISGLAQTPYKVPAVDTTASVNAVHAAQVEAGAGSPLPAETLARAAVRRPSGVGTLTPSFLRSFFDYDQDQEH